MSDLMKLIHDADQAAVELETARIQVETAKQFLETAKAAQEQARGLLDEVCARAEELGTPRSKIKKLVEERAQALVASGLIPAGGLETRTIIPKPPRAPRRTKITVDVGKEDFTSDLADAPANASVMELN